MPSSLKNICYEVSGGIKKCVTGRRGILPARNTFSQCKVVELKGK